jgi:hypothetical protein
MAIQKPKQSDKRMSKYDHIATALEIETNEEEEIAAELKKRRYHYARYFWYFVVFMAVGSLWNWLFTDHKITDLEFGLIGIALILWCLIERLEDRIEVLSKVTRRRLMCAELKLDEMQNANKVRSSVD